MKKFLKIIGLFFAGLLVGIGIFITVYWSDVRAFPGILSAFYSKEFCSCYFIVKKDEEFCHNVAKQYIAIDDFRLDLEKKTVTVSGLGRSTTTRFVGEKYGCKYVKPDQN